MKTKVISNGGSEKSLRWPGSSSRLPQRTLFAHLTFIGQCSIKLETTLLQTVATDNRVLTIVTLLVSFQFWIPFVNNIQTYAFLFMCYMIRFLSYGSFCTSSILFACLQGQILGNLRKALQILKTLCQTWWPLCPLEVIHLNNEIIINTWRPYS